MGFWTNAWFELPFKRLLVERFKPFAERDAPESSILIEYKWEAGPEGALTWPSQVVKLEGPRGRLKDLVQFPAKITGRPLKRAQPARAAADGLPSSRWLRCDRCNKWRKLLVALPDHKLPQDWYCHMSDDPKRKTCDDAEEAWETGGEWEEVVRGKAAASLLAPQSAVAAALSTEQEPEVQPEPEVHQESQQPQPPQPPQPQPQEEVEPKEEATEEAVGEEAQVVAAAPAAPAAPVACEPEQRELPRFMLALHEHLLALQREPTMLGASKWKFNAIRGSELETWSAEISKIKGKSGKACLRTRLLSETAIRMKKPDGLTFEDAEDVGGVSIEFFANLFTSAFTTNVAALGEEPPAVAAAAAGSAADASHDASSPELRLYPLFERGDAEEDGGKLLPYLPPQAHQINGCEYSRIRTCALALRLEWPKVPRGSRARIPVSARGRVARGGEAPRAPPAARLCDAQVPDPQLRRWS